MHAQQPVRAKSSKKWWRMNNGGCLLAAVYSIAVRTAVESRHAEAGLGALHTPA